LASGSRIEGNIGARHTEVCGIGLVGNLGLYISGGTIRWTPFNELMITGIFILKFLIVPDITDWAKGDSF
jgi:hypothetical protein